MELLRDIGFSRTPHIYAYVGGNPVSLTDPLGLCPPGQYSALGDNFFSLSSLSTDGGAQFWLVQSMAVVLNDGSTIPDPFLPGGVLLQPADVSLSINAAIGQFSSDSDYKTATMLALFLPGGLMDYQRSYGSNGLISPTYIDFGNFNFGVVSAAMGYTQAQALAGAGLANLLGSGNKSGPFFTNPRNNVFINAGYSAFINGQIGGP